MKPLFIPLKTEYFKAFEDGSKNTEFRIYGPRWNEKICAVGRKVVLSKGYGKQSRIHGTISSFIITHSSLLDAENRQAVKDIYGDDDVVVALIGMQDLKPFIHQLKRKIER